MRHERHCGVPSKQGLLLFLVLTCATTWLPAWLFQDLWRPRSPMLASGILQGSALYLGLIGWQPLIAVLLVRRFYEPPVGLNAGLRGASRRYAVLALLWPCAAMLLSSLFLMLLESVPPATVLTTPPRLAPRQAVLEVAAVSMACLMIYFQCWLEEIAWRGYFLVRAMECAGPWRGLVLHGCIWGAWYGTVLLITSGGPGSLAKAGAFVATCTLLGVLLGWLRLASRSVVPAVIANAVLTLGAGLPITLVGADVGPRGAVYEPIGWVPLSLLVACLALTSHRHAVATPRAPRPAAPFSTALH